MEAAVLQPAMMPELDCNSNTQNAELEVKKLQQLVLKLERQNQQLRNRANDLPGPLPSLLGRVSPQLLGEDLLYFQPSEDGAAGEDGYETSVLDDLELLDLDSTSEESDETWLYVPSKLGEAPNDITPLQWCRQVLDSPKSEVQAVRHSLSVRLEQVSRWRNSLSNPSSSPGPSLRRLSGVSPVSVSPSTKTCSTPQSAGRRTPCFSSPLLTNLPQTLSPVGKDASLVAERIPTFFPHPSRRRSLRYSLFSPESSVDSDLGSSEVEDDSIDLGYKLQDLTDVQVMARLQEENLRAHRYFSFINPPRCVRACVCARVCWCSYLAPPGLRQDYASTSSLRSKPQSYSFQHSAGLDLEEEDEEDDEDYAFLPPPQPRLTRLPHSHTFSSIRDWQKSTSLLSSPPTSPSTQPYPFGGFSFQTRFQSRPQGLSSNGEQHGFRPGSDKLGRSMPNLFRDPSASTLPLLTSPSSSPSLLHNSQSFDSSSIFARLQPSNQLQHRVQSLGSFTSLSRKPCKATAYVSPTIKGSGSTSTSLQSLSSSGSVSGIPTLSKSLGGDGATTRYSLPRPASIISTSTPCSKLTHPTRSLLIPPKSLSSLGVLPDNSWREGCY
ncbi:SLAIN motif-containing protein 1 isoform X1 [Synchiropus splendidus]|uniref:SLAIN motif-containing protein 1 isoform X1 n=1 Tax=Synchiropus splendidus TaxID=270530 RepID=UPI00237ED9DA|nr:SLAIN motif-containing protein 1 isoform X1 [Synchiropus splendidus]